MKKVVDARGVACPGPVIETKKALGKMEQGMLEVLVDNAIAVQNLEKLAAYYQLAVKAVQVDTNTYQVVFTVGGNSKDQEILLQAAEIKDEEMGNKGTSKNVVVISSEYMGEGNQELGKVLMKGFLYALTELEYLPRTILFYNGGAKLTVNGSDSLEDLKLLEEQGVEIMTCGACLNYYELTNDLAVGSVTNMYTIAEILSQASCIIRP